MNNIPPLVQIMACRRPGDKPSSESVMVNLLMHICVTLPQWVDIYYLSMALFDWHSADITHLCGRSNSNTDFSRLIEFLTLHQEGRNLNCDIVNMNHLRSDPQKVPWEWVAVLKIGWQVVSILAGVTTRTYTRATCQPPSRGLLWLPDLL